jgi:N-acetylglucosamine-6-phosphate deacetylase
LPTTWTDTPERIRAALETVAGMCGPVSDGAAVLGAHLEGPYINPDKRGAQRLEDVRRAVPDEVLPLLDLGVIRLLSLAPEFDDNLWLIEACVIRGITVSIAHTAASYEQVVHAADAGVTHATHTFNAMTPLSHREPGTVGAVLTLPQIHCELIADNIHVHPAAMRILFAAKGADGVILITDAVRAAGMPDGIYHLDARSVVVKDGAVRLPDGTLAGSMLTMDRALWNLIQATGYSLEQLWQTSSLNAARSIGFSHRKGSLEVGKDADLVLVDEAIRVYLTVSEGVIIYRQPM